MFDLSLLVNMFDFSLNWKIIKEGVSNLELFGCENGSWKNIFKFYGFYLWEKKEFECWTVSQRCLIFWIQFINCLLEIIKAFVLKIIGVIENKGFNLGSRFNLSAPIHSYEEKRNHGVWFFFSLSLLRLLIISLNIQQISWVMDMHSPPLFCFTWQD